MERSRGWRGEGGRDGVEEETEGRRGGYRGRGVGGYRGRGVGGIEGGEWGKEGSRG